MGKIELVRRRDNTINLFDGSDLYNIAELIKTLRQLSKAGYTDVDVYIDGSSDRVDVMPTVCSLETDTEYAARIKSYQEDSERARLNRIVNLRREARYLGFDIVKSQEEEVST